MNQSQIEEARARVARAQAWLSELEAVSDDTALSSPAAAVVAHIAGDHDEGGIQRCTRCARVLENNPRFHFAVGARIGESPAGALDGGGFFAFGVDAVPLCALPLEVQK